MIKHKFFTTLALAVLLSLSIAAPSLAGELLTAKKPIEGRYIVVLKDETAKFANERSTKPSVRTVAESMSKQHSIKVEQSFSHVLKGFVVEADEKALVQLILDDRVAFVEEDGYVSINQFTQNNAPWGLDRIDQRDLPLNSTYNYSTTASNVNTYIVDTGVRPTHNDFGGRVAAGFTSINDGRGSNDCNGHGTHVAGTVAGTTWGVAKDATIYPVRVLGCNGTGSNSGVIAGMDWIAANHVKPAVANMSLGGGASAATDNAVTNMRNAGVIVVVAAGNENQNACNVSPARSANAITVGSTTSSDTRSSFSNFGTCVDIFAPGSSITSAWFNSNSATRTISGTSMAAPHVAGIAALYLADNPTATPTQVENAIYAAATTGRLSGINSGSPNLLAYSILDGSGGGTPPPAAGELSNGVSETGLSGGTGSEVFFTLDVPAGASNLQFQISGGSGDADLYVRFGNQPTTGVFDCRPFLNGNNETCTFSTPAAGTWHVMIRGFQAYSGVTLVGSFVDPSSGGAPCTNCTQYSGSLTGTGDAEVQPNGTYYFAASAGTHNGFLRGSSNADFDLELYRWNGSSWVRVDSSASADSDEDISYPGTSGFYYWRVLSFSGSGTYDLWLDTP